MRARSMTLAVSLLWLTTGCDGQLESPDARTSPAPGDAGTSTGSAAECTRKSCATVARSCGALSDGCGGSLECGPCPTGQICGGGGAANVCGTGPCVPATCAGLMKTCGSVPDGCGAQLSCGTCPGTQTCGAANVCVGGATDAGRPDAGAPDAGPPSSGPDPILVGAGDISICGSNNGEPTAKLLDGLFANGANANGVVFTAGDNAYEDGTLNEYQTCYGPTWGRHKARTRPSPGNHERDVTANGGYFKYFGANAGDPSRGAYYSYELGKWHIVVLDSYGASVSASSPQLQWLKADLAAHPNRCTLAYFHAPRFNSGSQHGSQTFMQPAWQVLYDANADVVLSGHEHIYERFAPQTPAGVADPARGIRQFLVGTGGGTLYAIGAPVANSEVRYNASYGLLKLTLHESSYDWEFLPVAGASFTERGTGNCH